MSIFKYSFDTLEGTELEKVKGYFNACECHTATCTFLANYAWRDNYDLRYEEIGQISVYPVRSKMTLTASRLCCCLWPLMAPGVMQHTET